MGARASAWVLFVHVLAATCSGEQDDGVFLLRDGDYYDDDRYLTRGGRDFLLQDVSSLHVALVWDRAWTGLPRRALRAAFSAATGHLRSAELTARHLASCAAPLQDDGLIAVLSACPCRETWRLHKMAADLNLLHFAVTQADCPRLPSDTAMTRLMVPWSQHVSQLVLDLKTGASLRWKTAVILHDRAADDDSLQKLVASLSSDFPGPEGGPIAVSIFRLPRLQPPWRRRETLTRVLGKISPNALGSNFLVLTSRGSAAVVMEAARLAGLVGPRAQWLYLLADPAGPAHPGVGALESLLREGDNLAIAHNQGATPACKEQMLCSVEQMLGAFARAVDQVVQEEVRLLQQVSEEEWDAVHPTRPERRAAVLKAMKAELSGGGGGGGGCNCSWWRLEAADTWGSDFRRGAAGPRFDAAGEWNPAEGLRMRDHVFPHVRQGFRGRSLPLVSFHFPPWQIARRPTPRGNLTFHGVVFEVMSALARNLNFSYHVKILSSPSKGQPSNTSSKHVDEFGGETPDISAVSIPWTSLAEAVQQKRAFLAAVALPATDRRRSLLNFTTHLSIQPYSFLVSRPRERGRAFLFVYPFTREVWLCILGCVVTMGPLLRFIHLKSPYYDYHGKRRKGGLNSLYNCMWYVYGALLQQGGRHLPEADSGRIMVSTWWLVVLVIVTTYCGNLVAFLTFPKYEDTVESLQQLLQRPAGFSWGLLGGSDLADRLENSDDPRLKELFVHAKKHSEQGEQMVREVSETRHVYLEWKINLVYLMKRQYIANNRCDFILAKEDFWEEKLAMGIAADNPYLPIINEQIKMMHKVGLINKWLEQYLPRKDRCSTAMQQATEVLTHVVNLDDMQGSFFLLMLGVTWSLVLVGAELFYHWKRMAAERRLIRPYVT